MKAYRSERAGREIRRTYDKLLARWGVPYEEILLESPYGTTHVVATGAKDAEPAILLHGVGDDAALMWIYNAKSLAETYRIYAVDTIGGPGKSEIGAGYDKTFSDTLWLDSILDGLGLPGAHFAGVSHGGYLAQLYALERPERVRKVVALSSAVPAGEGGSPMKTMMKIFLPEALFPTKSNTIKLLRKLSGDNAEAFTDDPDIVEHYSWLLKGFNNMAMGFHNVRSFQSQEIDAIRSRVWYLAGEKDPFQLLGGRRALLANHMNVRFYPTAGHGLNHELASEINETIKGIWSGTIDRLL